MTTLIGYHEVKDTQHWLASPKREEAFGPLGVTNIRTFVDEQNPTHVAVLMDVADVARRIDQVDKVVIMCGAGCRGAADLLRAQFSFIYQHIVEDRRRREVLRMLIAEAPRFPELADRYHQEILRPCLDMLRQAIQRGMDRGEFRNSAIIDLPQIVIAPIALVDLWMMMFDDRQPLDMKAYFNAHLDLVLNGLLVK